FVGADMCSDHIFSSLKKIKKIRFIWRKVTCTISSLEINVRFVDSYPILHKVSKGKYNLSNEAIKPQDSIFISPSPHIFEPDRIGKVMQGYQWTYPFFKKQLNFCTVMFQD